MAILYVSTMFDNNQIINGNPATGIDGYGCSCVVDGGGVYGPGAGNIPSNGTKVGSLVNGQSAADPFGPYHQPVANLGIFTSPGEEEVFGIGFWNTADVSFAGWIAATSPTNTEETNWVGTGDGSGGMVLHTPNLTDDVYTLIVPTCAPLRQATNTRNGNSIVFHIPQGSLAVYAINANLETTGTITSSMTDTQASEQILGYGYGLILRAAGATVLFNQS